MVINMFFRGLAAGIYHTNSPEACHYVAYDSDANVLVVENDKQLAKILKVFSFKWITTEVLPQCLKNLSIIEIYLHSQWTKKSNSE